MFCFPFFSSPLFISYPPLVTTTHSCDCRHQPQPLPSAPTVHCVSDVTQSSLGSFNNLGRSPVHLDLLVSVCSLPSIGHKPGSPWPRGYIFPSLASRPASTASYETIRAEALPCNPVSHPTPPGLEPCPFKQKCIPCSLKF